MPQHPTCGGSSSERSTSTAVGRSAGLGAMSQRMSRQTCTTGGRGKEPNQLSFLVFTVDVHD